MARKGNWPGSGNTRLSSQTWRRWLFCFFPVLAYGALIFYLSHQRSWPIRPPDLFLLDKGAHFLEYWILGILVARAIEEGRFFTANRSKIFGVLLISFLYGLSDEFHQWFVPGRSATVGDVVADTLGGWFGGLTFFKRSMRDWNLFSNYD